MNKYAKTKAREFIIQTMAQADPSQNTNVGSALRGLLVLPFALTYAAVFNDIEILRRLYLGNYSNLSEGQMDLLAEDLLVKRPRGSRSVTVVRIYLDQIESFTLDIFPYFSTGLGQEFQPVNRVSYSPADFIEDGGLFYVNVPVISVLVGANTFADAGEINQFTNLPVTARSVTNISQTQGGDPSFDNNAFFSFIQKTFNDGTLNEVDGISQYVRETFSDVREIKTVTSKSPLMRRNEIWTKDFVHPNLDREGQPFSPVIVLGNIDFDYKYGRAYSATGVFTADMLNKRIAVSGDIEKFRKIIRYVSPNEVVLTGPIQNGTHYAELWSEGPKILNMADVYLYYPTLQIQSKIIDKRYNLVAIQNHSGPWGRIPFAVAEGFSYASYPKKGKLAIAEGTDREQVYTVFNSGFDGVNLFVDIPTTEVDIVEGDSMSLYDMSEILVGEDIVDTPVIYVIQIDQLDPLSFDLVEQINESQPGNFSDPGWYISNTDPAEVFSVREKKKIVLDAKDNLPSTIAVDEQSSRIIGVASYKSGLVTVSSTSNRVQKTTFDFSGMEGREVRITRNGFNLEDSSSSGENLSVASGVGTQTITVNLMNYRYSGDVGGRDDVVVAYFDSGFNLLGSFNPGEVLVHGNKITVKASVWPAGVDNVSVFMPQISTTEPSPDLSVAGGDVAWIDGVFKRWNGSAWVTNTNITSTPFIPQLSTEAVISSIPSTDTIQVTNMIPAILDANGLRETFNTTVSAESQGGTFDSGPVRVIYATHKDFRTFQKTVDEGQLLVKDTLVRSMLPAVIDSKIRYSGDAGSQEVFDRFVELLNTATTQASGERLRLDISNIISALDDEGLTDSIDVNFEIKVTTFLDDGEKIVQYINPEESTSQNLAIHTTANIGDSTVRVRRTKSVAPIPGRGVIRLGGNNPNIQESFPYEAVIDYGDGSFDIVLRGGYELEFAHIEWETVNLSVRDYDPELEFKDGAIYVPSNNRPYIRKLVIIKEG